VAIARFIIYWQRYYSSLGRSFNAYKGAAHVIHEGEDEFWPDVDGYKRNGGGFDFYFPFSPPSKRTILNIWE
jgi:hypothetical protein